MNFRLRYSLLVISSVLIFIVILKLSYNHQYNRHNRYLHSEHSSNNDSSISQQDKLPINYLDKSFQESKLNNKPISIKQLNNIPLDVNPLNVSKHYSIPNDYKYKYLNDDFNYSNVTVDYNNDYNHYHHQLNLNSIYNKQFNKIQYHFRNYNHDHLTSYRQSIIKNAFLHAWNSYKQNAFGFDEIHPLTGKPFNMNPNKFKKSPFNGWGATIIDNLDNLIIMNLFDDYNLVRDHVNRLNFNYVHNPSGELPTFETNIRYLGGLISAYDLSNDKLMLDKAIELGDILLQSFNTHSGIPSSVIKPHKRANDEEYTILAESGSMILEFTKLTMLTGDNKYFNAAQNAQNNLFEIKSTLEGLLPTHIRLDNEINQTPRSGVFTIGALSDSYYEYLIKVYRLVNSQLKDYSNHYINAIEAINQNLVTEIGANIETFADLTITGEVTSLSLSKLDDEIDILPKWEHLGCFSGGMLALGSKLLSRPLDLYLGSRITESCFQIANNTLTGLAPEGVIFDTSKRKLSNVLFRNPPERHRPYRYRSMSSIHLGRPEIIESIFVLYRLTGDEKWRVSVFFCYKFPKTFIYD